MKLGIVIACLHLCISAMNCSSQTLSPGGPGNDAQWASAAKQGIGTSADTRSKVWFTLAQGVMTEVYYPDVTTANVHVLQFIVVDPNTKKVETERDDAIHQIKVLRPDSLTFQQINTAKSGKWKITKTYVTDPSTDAVFIKVDFEHRRSGLDLYVLYDPSLGNNGNGDEGFEVTVTDQRPELSFLGARDKKAVITSELAFSSPISELKNSYDGVSDLISSHPIHSASPNFITNLVQSAKIDRPQHFTAVLLFKNTELVPRIEEVVQKNFAAVRIDYERGWARYVRTLPKVDPRFQAQFNMAAMVLKALEDKTVRGANVASLGVPWGGGANANEDVGGGYHLVWSRDLYEVVTAYLALGDTAAANRALDFLFNFQQKPDGSFPQNSWLDGKRGWGSLQMDEVGYPLILAYQLGRFDKTTYGAHVKPAADFIVETGPATPEDRWEERPGYSPSTIAAEIAGLVCAAEIAKKNGDGQSADLWLRTADDWQANVEKWTATTTGKYGDGHYYIRLSASGEPDGGHTIELNNGAGTFPENDIVDAGFLELVRLGIKRADDPLIEKSVKVIDQVLKVDTPNGPGFYRYSHDGYGEMDDGRKWNWDGKYTGKGRLWTLLSGERGEYEIAICELGTLPKPGVRRFCLSQPYNRLESMQGFSNDGLMIPEQVWDSRESPAVPDPEFEPQLKFGEGTGSATPLAWSMAQFIRLAMNLKAGYNLETPKVVADRYANRSDTR